MTLSVVLNLWKQFWDTGSLERKHGKSHSRATMGREDRHLQIIVRRNRDATASLLSRELFTTAGTRVSWVIVSRRLHERGLFAR
ncbi:HTH_Tnp_Tc3_2 domain-containing protein [Trichonephila clavipes]|nr:HTH_Tnp_Tc3_2 domain-containing protein [Trichonephila clavipes]